MKRVLAAMLIIGLLISLCPVHVSALSCAELPTMGSGISKYDGVIIARVDKVAEQRDSNLITLTVERSFKGITQEKLKITENKTWGSLWGPSEVGSTYLFFLNQGEAATWENPLCSPTKLVSEVTSEELDLLSTTEIELVHQEPVVNANLERGATTLAIMFTTLGLVVIGTGIFLWIKNTKS